ncbi:MAG: GNAT family N-acetyltransferase [Firmicutes bacterium]|nr:GNAT family N-acetyltransferase [Bacillota bacterium]
MTVESGLTLSPATPSDLDSVVGLVRSAGLPTDGIAENLQHFKVARDPAGRLAGVAGAEIYGDQALLRSVCIAPEYRGKALGSRLTGAIMDYVRDAGCKEVYLLTTTAAGYFARKGFARVDRSAVSGPVLKSVEFATACPKTATVMLAQMDTTG